MRPLGNTYERKNKANRTLRRKKWRDYWPERKRHMVEYRLLWGLKVDDGKVVRF